MAEMVTVNSNYPTLLPYIDLTFTEFFLLNPP